ncbi:MAG TPA: glycogen-binding domain-containing protein [Planctomycetota bacterium]|nr:glycogen-binding domain-containing protein [Planctomycetota bacterium]
MSGRTSRTKGSRIVVETRAPDAKEVFLAGTFNGWDAHRQPMRPATEAAWKAELQLPPGTYEYKFVVDGRWCCNPSGDEPTEATASCVRNVHGTMNRVLVVEAPAAGTRRLEQDG